MFFLYANTILCSLLLNEYTRVMYPRSHAGFWTNVMYYSVHIFSTGEQFINKHIPTIFSYDNYIINNLELILNDDTNYITDTEQLLIDQYIPKEYKLAIYARLGDNNVRKKRIYKTLPEVYDCEETSYKFILVELKYDDTCTKIDFKTAASSYYVVNNEFDATVIRYLMKSLCDIDVPKKYTICILDHNVKKVEFDNTCILKFNKDSYEIISETVIVS